MEDVRWGLLVAYCMRNFVSRTLKLGTEFSASPVNHPKGSS